MKNETFFEFMRETAIGWRDKAGNQEHREEYETFLRTLNSFKENARNFDTEQKVMIEAVIDFAKSSLKALLFINAGGVFIIMMAVSAIVSKDSKFVHLLAPLARECSYFLFGIVSSVCSVSAAYIAQRLYAANCKDRYGDYINVVSVIFGVLSLLAFVLGALALRNVFITVACPGS